MEQQSIIKLFNEVLQEEKRIRQLSDFSDGLFFLRILALVEGIEINESNIKLNPQNWQMKLSNLKYAVGEVEKYFLKEKMFFLLENPADLLEIAKNDNLTQTVKVVETVFYTLLIASNKNEFIEKITMLSLGDQQTLQHKIVQFFNFAETKQVVEPHKQESSTILQKLGELEERLSKSEQKNIILKEHNNELKRQLQKYKQANQKLIETIRMFQKQQVHQKQFQEKITETDSLYLKDLIKQLESKIISDKEQHEKQCVKYEEQIELLQNCIGKKQKQWQIEHESEIRIKHSNEKISTLEDRNTELYQQTVEQEQKIKKLQAKIKMLKQDLSRVQFQTISLKADNAKVSVRSSELQKLLSVSIEHKKPSQRMVTETMSSIHDEYETKYEQTKEELSIANKRVRELEKQLARISLKLQKLQKVEQQKKKLQVVLIDFTNSRGQEVEILLNAMYEMRVSYQVLLRKGGLTQDSTIASIEVD